MRHIKMQAAAADGSAVSVLMGLCGLARTELKINKPRPALALFVTFQTPLEVDREECSQISFGVIIM